MALPHSVRVKLSSEAAEAISLTPVVVQDLPIRDLVEHLLGVTGKDETRIRELLLRGSLVSGASRFRWTGMEADPASVHALLGTFPDPEPARPFAAGRCVRVVLRTPRYPIGIPRADRHKIGIGRYNRPGRAGGDSRVFHAAGQQHVAAPALRRCASTCRPATRGSFAGASTKACASSGR